jgi:D-3-phosphoglycerate dehydrogenase / 2-oxoglutarate reductase
LKNEKWRDKTLIGFEIKNKTIGIVGCGAIGRLIAKKLQNFEVRNILGYDPYLTAEQMKSTFIEKTELDHLLKVSDIVTLHMPLTPETRNMISYETFKTMKPDSMIINAARGGIIHEPDLVRALHEKLIKAAALDVYESEPDIRKELLSFNNLITTPHIAGFTIEADEEMSLMPVRRFLDIIK